jgi:hypothetical protein
VNSTTKVEPASFCDDDGTGVAPAFQKRRQEGCTPETREREAIFTASVPIVAKAEREREERRRRGWRKALRIAVRRLGWPRAQFATWVRQGARPSTRSRSSQMRRGAVRRASIRGPDGDPAGHGARHTSEPPLAERLALQEFWARRILRRLWEQAS